MIAATYYKYNFSTIEGYLEGKPQKIKSPLGFGHGLNFNLFPTVHLVFRLIGLKAV